MTIEQRDLDRVDRENREWRAARLHHAMHGSWLAPDECATCLEDAMKQAPGLAPLRGSSIALAPRARLAIGAADLAALETRCADIGVLVSAVKRTDHQWMIRVSRGVVNTSLVGRGPLAAIIAGALDDWQALA